jgi:predicted MPP superfamily phosphohydrolase
MPQIFLFVTVLAIPYLFFSISQSLQTERNDVDISVFDSQVRPTSFSIAVIGDVHLPEGQDYLAAFRSLLLEVKAAKPDLVLFVGDYTANPGDVEDMPKHRPNIIEALKLVDPIPRAVVLGNYESWSDADTWLTEFARLRVEALENETRFIDTENGPICVRGFGDRYTDRFEFSGYPEACGSLPKLSITHDPVGAFEDGVTGLVIAAHTHCGQVSLAFVGPLWVPSEAPSDAHCGLYQDRDRTVFVTSGVGTSILPLRYGAQLQWDLIYLSFIKERWSVMAKLQEV